jgi:hypothetical protein
MGRIQQAYEARLRALLRPLNARRPERAVQWMLAQAQSICAQRGAALPLALAQVCARTQRRLDEWRSHRHRSGDSGDNPPKKEAPARFYCDAGLGGLARWLRAAGYPAEWRADIDDQELIREARRLDATLVTTDSLLMERRIIRDGNVPALWVPPTLGIREQLALLLQELNLPLREPRCMACGGELRAVDKEAVRQRIPPRTYRWLDEYFECDRCGKLFWHGTHWQRIRSRLLEQSDALAGPAERS